MTRSKIRYALFRCKANTAEKEHNDILESFKTQLDEFGLDITDFTKEWDIDSKDTTQIVTGKIARNMNREKSLFSSDGGLKA